MTEIATRSIDDQIFNTTTYGGWAVLVQGAVTATTTASDINNGATTMQKFPLQLTIPSFTSPVTGAYCSRADVITEDSGSMVIAGYEVLLGSINMGTNTFTSGSPMPTRTVKGTSITTATEMIMAVATTACNAAASTLTVTYTDQDGNTGQTMTWAMPNATTAINSAFSLSSHLATGDSGIREITNISRSSGSSGTLSFYGVHVINNYLTPTQYNAYHQAQPQQIGNVPWICEAGDKIGFYRVSNTTSCQLLASMFFVPDI